MNTSFHEVVTFSSITSEPATTERLSPTVSGKEAKTATLDEPAKSKKSFAEQLILQMGGFLHE